MNPVFMIVGLVAILLITAILIISIIYFAKKNTNSKTELTIEVTKLLKVYFKQENKEKL